MHRMNQESKFLLAGLAVLATLTTASATEPGWLNDIDLSLHDGSVILPGRQQESATATTAETSTGWTLDGPYFLRSANPLEAGEIELKLIYGYEKEADGEEHEVEFVFEWGWTDDIEFILEMPVEVGEGRIDGNGDITQLGFHIRHWDEDGWMPAFATRHLVRVPTGYHSDGVDYLARGLFTKTLVSDKLRMHFNPWFKSVNGNLEEDERHSQCGAAIGVDYRASDDLLFILDYQNRTSEVEGSRNHHSIEFGADWEFADDNILAFQTEFEIDGDESGPDFSAHISYILELDFN